MEQRVEIDGSDFLIDLEKEGSATGTVNGNRFELDVNWISENRLHIIRNSRSYDVELLDGADGISQIKINGNIYEAKLVSRFDELLKRMGLQNGSVGKVSDVKAPMPGMVLDIVVKVGDQVQKGDRLLVLEAMKMENVIKSPTDGTVGSIDTEKGRTVEKNQVMLKFAHP